MIVDRMSIKTWQALALEHAAGVIDVVLILDCTNTRTTRSMVRNGLYYCLNLFSLRNRLTKRVECEPFGARVVSFRSSHAGSWQALPVQVVEAVNDAEVDVVIKFGMSLLRVPPALASTPILSYHHGDPSLYRGRPAGFYELLHGRSTSGVIVQSLTNDIDGGAVLAFAHARLTPHSYKASALEFYSISRFLLREALVNLSLERYVEFEGAGACYRLPSNATVASFLLRLSTRRMKRLLYGAFVEKRWNVGVSSSRLAPPECTIDVAGVRQASVVEPYGFYADPFFSLDGDVIRLEALDRTTGLGEIIELDALTLEQRAPLIRGPHLSYPVSCRLDGSEYVLPEIASSRSPILIAPGGDIEAGKPLLGLEHRRLLDATPLHHAGHWYLFAVEKEYGAGVLLLFVAERLDARFVEHPSSPVVIDPSRARMAGRIHITEAGEILRFGQDNRGRYGAGITICRITELGPDRYEEEPIGSVRMSEGFGPHTIDIHGERTVLDFYSERVSPLAGCRRVAARVRGRIRGGDSSP